MKKYVLPRQLWHPALADGYCGTTAPSLQSVGQGGCHQVPPKQQWTFVSMLLCDVP